MGMEYTLRFTCRDNTKLDVLLRALPNYERFDSTRQRYLFRFAENTGKMPNAEIKIEPQGVYFCDFGSSYALLGLLITRLTSLFGEVQMEEREP